MTAVQHELRFYLTKLEHDGDHTLLTLRVPKSFMQGTFERMADGTFKGTLMVDDDAPRLSATGWPQPPSVA